MARLSIAFLICFVALCCGSLTVQGLDSPLFGGELGQERPLLRAIMLSRLVKELGGTKDIPAPLSRGLMAENVAPPVLRVLLNRFASKLQQEQPDENQLLRSIVLFRLVSEQIGKKIIEEFKNQVQSRRVYTFHHTFSWNTALEYIDENGELSGFTLGLIDAVCEEANRTCVSQYDVSKTCYTSQGEQPRAGEGILGRQFDVCVNWVKSNERERALAFTKPHWKDDLTSKFFVKSGNPGGFDPKDMSASTVGFVDGWMCDEHCILSGSDLAAPSATKYYNDVSDLVKGLEDGEVDAFFLYAYLADTSLYEAVGDAVVCNEGTVHMMTRKDSDVLEWWNDSLDRVIASGKYYGLCNKARSAYGSKGDIKCITN
ncbi:putative ABC transporter arginine-binding protein 2 [Saccoglossus kowalevskii]|uniref:Uncharacterized protein LOC100368170 n=1 Tax=Saccoglossus kowalevskii TaxID=10224 RepID=A0ABM0GLA4_SACKO|nr:PREDICTED: uncharacterized protein LOC100368170 [Saccoglossus kowalevskii]